MRKKLVFLAGFLLMIGLLVTVGPARAGGWATLTVSELPAVVVAERPFTIEFTLRQHGQTAVTGFEADILATHAASGEQLRFATAANPEAENYIATVTLPQAGEWQWEINSWGVAYPMPPLRVNEAVVGGEIMSGTAVPWQLILGWMAAAGALLCLFFWTRQQNRVRLAGVVLLGVVSLTSFALHTQIAQPVLAESEADLLPAVEPEAMGEALFVAKGCIQCHVYDRVTMAENMIQIGPNLTYVKRSPEYLQAWLTNPPALKPETQMPNLQLSEAEIDELVAFLQQD